MKRKKVFVAVMGGVLSMGLVGASAATLGTLSGAGLGADDQVVAGCDTDGITVGYITAYSDAAQTYQVTAVNFTGVNAACNAKAASVSLRNGTTTSRARRVRPWRRGRRLLRRRVPIGSGACTSARGRFKRTRRRRARRPTRSPPRIRRRPTQPLGSCWPASRPVADPAVS